MAGRQVPAVSWSAAVARCPGLRPERGGCAEGGGDAPALPGGQLGAFRLAWTVLVVPVAMRGV